uniref:Uncharacterized protein n=1 Tax=Tetranychus urticae TaxID=32264 RepID=T1K262_TETUR
MDNLNQVTLSSSPALRKRIGFLVHLLITAICTVQIYSIAIDYLYGEITTKVNLTTPKTFTLPNVSLCFPFLGLINLTIADQHFQNFSAILKNRPFFDDYDTHRDTYTEIYSLLATLTTSQLKGLLKDIGRVTPMIKLTPIYRTNDSITGQRRVDVKSSCEITRYFRQPSFCLTIRCFNETKQPLEYVRADILQQPHNGDMMRIKLSPNVTMMAPSVDIVFTAANHLTHGKKQSAYRIGFTKENPATYVITYTKIINILIQDDYEISCFNYSLIGYLSRDDYFDRCLNNASSTTTGTAFYGTVQHFKDTRVLMSGFRQFYDEYLNPNEAEREKKRKFYKYCRKYCSHQANRPDCYQEIFNPIGFRTIHRSDGIYEIVVRAPATPFELNQYYPEYTLLDLLIYFASSLNFWFGLSLISLSEQLLNFYCNLFVREKKPKNNSTIKLSKAKVVSSKPIEVLVAQPRRPRVTKLKDIPNEIPIVYY